MKYLNQLVIVVLLLSIGACGDDSIEYGEPQLPITTLATELEYQTSYTDTGNPTEMGCLFSPLRDGRITSVCVLMPNDGVYRATLWNLSDTSVVASMNIATLYLQLSCTEIAPFEVSMGNSYAITVYTEDFVYYHYPGDHTRPIYPVVVGDVELTGFKLLTNPGGLIFPWTYRYNELKGLVDVIFEPLI